MTEEFKDFETMHPSIKDFIKYHGKQLINNEYPMNRPMIERLYAKLMNEIYDSGELQSHILDFF
jgi:ubiquitin-protein ligase